MRIFVSELTYINISELIFYNLRLDSDDNQFFAASKSSSAVILI